VNEIERPRQFSQRQAEDYLDWFENHGCRGVAAVRRGSWNVVPVGPPIGPVRRFFGLRRQGWTSWNTSVASAPR
jgi:hypothetical protein